MGNAVSVHPASTYQVEFIVPANDPAYDLTSLVAVKLGKNVELGNRFVALDHNLLRMLKDNRKPQAKCRAKFSLAVTSSPLGSYSFKVDLSKGWGGCLGATAFGAVARAVISTTSKIRLEYEVLNAIIKCVATTSEVDHHEQIKDIVKSHIPSILQRQMEHDEGKLFYSSYDMVGRGQGPPVKVFVVGVVTQVVTADAVNVIKDDANEANIGVDVAQGGVGVGVGVGGGQHGVFGNSKIGCHILCIAYGHNPATDEILIYDKAKMIPGMNNFSQDKVKKWRKEAAKDMLNQPPQPQHPTELEPIDIENWFHENIHCWLAMLIVLAGALASMPPSILAGILIWK